MVTIPKPSNIQSSKLAVTSAPVIQGRDDGAGLVAQSISELAGTTHEIFKKAVENLNLSKDNAYIAQKKAEIDKFAIELLEQDKVNYDEGLDGYAEGTKSQIIAKQQKLLAEAPNEIIRNKLNTYFPGQSTYWFNKAYQEEVRESTSYLSVQRTDAIKEGKEQVYKYFKDGGDIQGGHLLKMRISDLIRADEGISLNAEAVEQLLTTWNKDYIDAMFLGFARNTKNQTTTQITTVLVQHLDNNKEEFIKLLDGEEKFQSLRADVLQVFSEEIRKEFARNETALEPGYDGSPYRTIALNIKNGDIFLKNDDGTFKVDEFDGITRIINESFVRGLHLETLPDFQREALEQYIKYSTNLEKYKIEDDLQAVEQIDILIADDQDPRQELNFFFKQNLLSPQTYSKKMNEYNKLTGPDLKDRALQNKIKRNEAQLKDFKALQALSFDDIAKMTNEWSDILLEKEDIYKNNPDQHDEDFAKFLKKHGGTVASIYKTMGSPMPDQSNYTKSQLVDGDETALNDVLVATLVYAQNTWPDDIEKQREYLQEQSGLINEVKNVWEANHIDSKTGKKISFIWRDINKGVLEKIKQGLEIEKTNPDARPLTSLEKNKKISDFGFDNIYEKIQEIIETVNENPSYITDGDSANLPTHIKKQAENLFTIIEKTATTDDAMNWLSTDNIIKIIEAGIFQRTGPFKYGEYLSGKKFIETFDPEFKHVTMSTGLNPRWKQKLIDAGERANTNE